MKSLQGQFLVAAAHELDPRFVEAVILVVEHTDRGAFGVIVNCPQDRHAGGARQRTTKRRWGGRPGMYVGGPVTGPLMALHTDTSFADIEVLPGVFFAGTEESVLALLRSKEQTCKVFTGCAAWAAGHLEHEVEFGVWRVVPAKAAEIFSNGDDLWERLLRQAVDSLLRGMCKVKHIPSDASLN